MALTQLVNKSARYRQVKQQKATGATYTPPELADFVAHQMLGLWVAPKKSPIRILDPAIGEGELILSLLKQLPTNLDIEVYGFDSNQYALEQSSKRIKNRYPGISLFLTNGDFLKGFTSNSQHRYGTLFEAPATEIYDLIIANPPYVRTQIMGAAVAQALANQFNLTGRIDLYQGFLIAIAEVLSPNGVAGVITSNRFMTTKTGSGVRQAIQKRMRLNHVWDFGDTKLFDAAVLPAVLIGQGLNGVKSAVPLFSSIYETKNDALFSASSITHAAQQSGVVAVPDGRRFLVKHGSLSTSAQINGVWRIATEENDAWLCTVKSNTWSTFGGIGKVRVGVKTCADKVFIRKDWSFIPEEEQPELLCSLATHHHAKRYKGSIPEKKYQIVYPHEIANGKRRPIDIDLYPRTKAYLEEHRAALESRSYVIEAGRKWYEIWVPQDPAAWGRRKLVFKDISEEPCFWIDLEGSVVNGDCYWLITNEEKNDDLLWLAVSIGNSTFVEAFYDHSFNNKLYAGRRRYITQYVEKFPLPNPTTPLSKLIISKAKEIYAEKASTERLEEELNAMVWESFGLVSKKV